MLTYCFFFINYSKKYIKIMYPVYLFTCLSCRAIHVEIAHILSEYFRMVILETEYIELKTKQVFYYEISQIKHKITHVIIYFCYTLLMSYMYMDHHGCQNSHPLTVSHFNNLSDQANGIVHQT